MTQRLPPEHLTWAKPSAARIIPAYLVPRSLGMLPSAGIEGSPLAFWMLPPIPRVRAISLAITVWSPVICAAAAHVAAVSAALVGCRSMWSRHAWHW
jgi:hypothetical protein